MNTKALTALETSHILVEAAKNSTELINNMHQILTKSGAWYVAWYGHKILMSLPVDIKDEFLTILIAQVGEFNYDIISEAQSEQMVDDAVSSYESQYC